ncbi:hypothetical protein HYH03_016623 [Edaphochlamys debaryana]|uniref:Uncharacterized protein n=1 Tax=Edaphochlamys debaryana TaxID=47281 RepID=A0A835XPC0_9CHLO|nr:hypothetical protein HYH03_016623 [Edaphochlamys debaryana]|eukprot:KAG2484580.1 hypothetical protein HYH03_016623 [Edaphochlamys debaryana]
MPSSAGLVPVPSGSSAINQLLQHREQSLSPAEPDEAHQSRLFAWAASAILALPDPRRLAFYCLPSHGAAAVLRVLRAAGYDNLWDEPCHRYARAEPLYPEELAVVMSDPSSAACGSGAAGSPAEVYRLDSLRSEADCELVDSLWTYKSSYSLPLVRLLVQHRHTVCARYNSRGQEGGSDRKGPAVPVGSDTGPVGGSEPGPEASASGSGSDAVAWILHYGDGSIGLAHTLEAHRRRGLMRRCGLEMVRRLLGPGRGEAEEEQEGSTERGAAGAGAGAGAGGAGAGGGGGEAGGWRQREVFLFVVQGNGASVALFEGLGFRCCAAAWHWLGVEGE